MACLVPTKTLRVGILVTDHSFIGTAVEPLLLYSLSLQSSFTRRIVVARPVEIDDIARAGTLQNRTVHVKRILTNCREFQMAIIRVAGLDLVENPVRSFCRKQVHSKHANGHYCRQS